MSRFPWVPRRDVVALQAAFERATSDRDDWSRIAADQMARADQERAERIAERDAADRRYAALLEKYHDALTPKAPAAVSLTPVESKPDPIRDLIREQCVEEGRVNYALQEHLRSYAYELKRQGKSTDEILGALVKWSTTERPESETATWQ